MSDQQITVWAENFVCERESTEASSSDEIYFDFYAHTSNGANSTVLSQVFTSVDAGETHSFTNAALWQQTVPADGLTVAVIAWEEDGGIDERGRRERFHAILGTQGSGTAEGLTGLQIRSGNRIWGHSSSHSALDGDDTVGGYVFKIPLTDLGTAQNPSTFEALIDGTARGETRVRLRLRAHTGAPSRRVKLINVNSGKALTVSGASTDNGANVDQWTYYPSQPNQHWHLADTGNGHSLTNANSGKALTVHGATTDDGANVDQWTYKNQANQHWHLEDTGNGYKLTNANSGKALTVHGASTDDGGNVDQWSDAGYTNQRWYIQDA
ncbi:RICIN domain-containing protein [Streptomyces uncialis]|uniref:RICIN domain-containing protein n=1 Tax=Streptomyces uncialis TaxID=1048205 RepID=UPI002F90BBBE|nr:RICIN domain-containing protein [Streptomyces uncialis]